MANFVIFQSESFSGLPRVLWGTAIPRGIFIELWRKHKVGLKSLSFPLIRSLQISTLIIFYGILKKTRMVSKVVIFAYLEF